MVIYTVQCVPKFGEADFNGVVRGAGMGLGFQSLLRDLGQDAPVRVWTDSSVAIGISSLDAHVEHPALSIAAAGRTKVGREREVESVHGKCWR